MIGSRTPDESCPTTDTFAIGGELACRFEVPSLLHSSYLAALPFQPRRETAKSAVCFFDLGSFLAMIDDWKVLSREPGTTYLVLHMWPARAQGSMRLAFLIRFVVSGSPD